MTPTRGERNCNPGSLREYFGDGTHWIGERATDDDKTFEEFNTPEDGIRALAKVLKVYQSKHQLDTLRKIIGRWAPPNENDTGAYLAAVCKQMSCEPDAKINLERREALEQLVRAIIHQENGRVVYADAVISEGVGRA